MATAPPADHDTPAAGPRRLTYRNWGAVTAVSELRPRQRWRLLTVFAFGNATTLAIRPLLRMRVIALARWTLWPSVRHPRFLVFETNWSGSDQTYIPDFGRIMPVQWRSIWGATTLFEGSVPTTRLLAWIDEIDAGVGHFWTDYEAGATTQAIAQALELRPAVQRFARDTAGLSPGDFAARWHELVVKIHRLL